MAAERLQKVLARAGVASRRRAEDLIAAGRVTVNGVRAGLGDQADPAVDRIEVNGVPLQTPSAEYYAVHKPRGMLSSVRGERGRRSVVELVPAADGTRLWPAGRLDADSEGLMVLTNDGDWANRVLHPRYGVEREYAVLVEPVPTDATLGRLLRGVELEDGPARLLEVRREEPPPEVEHSAAGPGAWLRVRLGEGRKREVRRLFAAVEHRVPRLVRTRLGPLSLDGLRSGAFRRLSGREVAELIGRRPRVRAGRRGGTYSVAIDGPSGSGKSTVGYAVAERLGATFVDTGLMYRALTFAAAQRGIDPDDGRALGALATQLSIQVRRPRAEQTDRLETILLDGRDVTRAVRTPEIDRLVSSVSRHAEVRRAMLDVQRRAARRRATVMVGRDIGTVVLPDARLKVYLTASTEVRAARRAAEMGQPERAEEYLAEIARRDELDSNRQLAPLRVAPGALVLDTGELDVSGCVEAIVDALGVAGEERE
jgi:cytidylate kinase